MYFIMSLLIKQSNYFNIVDNLSYLDINYYLTELYNFLYDLYSYILIESTTSTERFIALFSIIILTITILTYLIFNYLSKSNSDKLLKTLSKNDSVSILMHDNPDPDAMACALGMERLLSVKGIECEIMYPGKISHHENRAFRAVLDVSFESITHSDEIGGNKIILVDHHIPRGFINSSEIEPDIVVDHHEATQSEEDADYADFWHVNSSLGSCSTIITQYLDEQGLSFSKLNAESESEYVSETVVTALFYGIMSDTSNLTQGVTDEDYKAALKLYDGVNQEKLHRISTPKIDEEALDTKAKAILNRDVRGPFAVCDVDEVSNEDAIPQSADEIVQLEGLSAVIVFGKSEDEIRISGRAYDDRVHLGEAIQKALEDIPKSTAGGHSEMGGGTIPNTVFEYEDITREELKEKFFKVLKGEE